MESLILSNIFAFIVGIIGVVGTLFCGWVVYVKDKKRKESCAASLLYNDLKSIERYLIYDEESLSNIRYSPNWQNIVSDCAFLKNKDISLLYLIYDEIYYYNYLFDLLEERKDDKEGKNIKGEKEKIYKSLRDRMFNSSINERYNKLTKRLEAHIKN